MSKEKILYLCTGNSCRSQMAEGWTRELKSEQFEAYSAGIEKHGLNENAVRVMKEAGVDISQQESQTIDELPDLNFDYVVTVCDSAREACPVYPGGTKQIHAGFDDPPRLAKQADSKKEALDIYRRVRDEIRQFVKNLSDLSAN